MNLFEICWKKNRCIAQYSAAIAIVMALLSCRSPINDAAFRYGTTKRKTDVKFNGLARTYRLHIPEYRPLERWPLIIVLHGAFSTARKMEKETGFSHLADQQGFCVAYPNGIGLFGKLQHWNAGHCCGKASKEGVDDVAYIDSVINDITSSYLIDSTRIYIVGFSNGGMMAYRYAAERADKLAAAAIVAGAINSKAIDCEGTWTPEQPASPLPVLIMHGTNDDIIPSTGGKSPDRHDRSYSSVEDARTFWETYNAGQGTVQVELLQEWGHMWPGPYFTDKKNVAETMQHYNAAEVIWSFFQQQ